MIYKKNINEKKKTKPEMQTVKTVKLLWGAMFPLWKFKLDCEHALLVILKVADIFNFKYRRLSMWAKTIFHIKQIKFEILRFKILMSHSCYYIIKIELELMYI